ncbi:hypothetical protein RHSIM_Rhsim03G0099000 [Rhododendron simsii]|uniref:diphosphomevalonate decarboxylase n=1 Tax=Rhododendron simsii TaxID=118357 RepID=A0A834LV10_RHOSS|nr:hypothetical protein RHSIM_Rhsim03G0099000 [Rhododendron simsii]
MADQSKRWILMTTAQTPTNIAVIKYWGKRDENLILPINDSISVTLDPEHLCTTTTVAVSPSFDTDRMWLNKKFGCWEYLKTTWERTYDMQELIHVVRVSKKLYSSLEMTEISLSSDRYQRCLREIRSRANDFEDEKKGIKITKKDWENLHVHIDSYNNFPTAAGLASSAAGFACFVFSLARLMNVKEDLGKLSAIARQGSGSACRSLYGGFVKWNMGKNDDGSDSVAVQLADEKQWDDLVIIIAVFLPVMLVLAARIINFEAHAVYCDSDGCTWLVSQVSSRQKETSSTTGMRETVETSKLIQHRAKEVVPKRIVDMEEAIKNRDFPSFARLTCSDSNQFHAVCLDTSPPIFYMNDTSHRHDNWLRGEMEQRRRFTPDISGVEDFFRCIVAYTFDAGPNAVLIARNRKVAALLLQRLLFYFPPHPDTDLDSYVIGDKSILQDAGVKDKNDVEALPPPLEIKGNIPAQKYMGDVSYFICTRPGRGPVLLGDESLALLSPETGLPK